MFVTVYMNPAEALRLSLYETIWSLFIDGSGFNDMFSATGGL